MDLEYPANKAMDFYFEKTDYKRLRGHPRTTLVIVLSQDIRRMKKKDPTFPTEHFISKEDLQNICILAENREG